MFLEDFWNFRAGTDSFSAVSLTLKRMFFGTFWHFSAHCMFEIYKGLIFFYILRVNIKLKRQSSLGNNLQHQWRTHISMAWKLQNKTNFNKTYFSTTFEFLSLSSASTDLTIAIVSEIAIIIIISTLVFTSTGWKVFVFGVFLVRILPGLDWIRRNAPYLSVFSPNGRKFGPEKLRIRTLFTQWRDSRKYDISYWRPGNIKSSKEKMFNTVVILQILLWH